MSISGGLGFPQSKRGRGVIAAIIFTGVCVIVGILNWELVEKQKRGLKRRGIDNPCGSEMGLRPTDLVFCTPEKGNYTVFVPYTILYNGTYGENSDWQAQVTSITLTSRILTRCPWLNYIISLVKTTQGLMVHLDISVFQEYIIQSMPCHTIYLSPSKDDKPKPHIVRLCVRNISTPIASDSMKQAGGVIVPRPEKADDWFRLFTGLSGQGNNWLLLVEQAAKGIQTDCVVCMGPRPMLKVVPSVINPECVIHVMNNTMITNLNCTRYDTPHPVVEPVKVKPIFDKRIAKNNFTCIKLQGKKHLLANITSEWCAQTINVSPDFNPQSRADVWWWCSDEKLYDRLPRNSTGRCALVSLILPVSVASVSAEEVMKLRSSVVPEEWHRVKRATKYKPWLSADDPTYIDAIGVPRGVPDEYKLANQVTAGFESIFIWITPNKNVDRINYIHYNVQKLGNYTEEALSAVHEQLSATSLMSFQNRIALDMLLAEKSGVCGIFGESCCTFIPNNTQAGGRLTVALEGLRAMNKRLKDQSGVDTSLWDSWMSHFGEYKALVSSVLLAIAIFASILTVCGCCCIPCIRALLLRLINTAIGQMPKDGQGQYVQLRTTESKADMKAPVDVTVI